MKEHTHELSFYTLPKQNAAENNNAFSINTTVLIDYMKENI